MPALSTAVLVINSLAIVFALVLLLLIVWQDWRRPANWGMVGFLAMLALWSGGTLLSRFAAFAGAPDSLVALGVRMLEIGFTGVCAGLYLMTLLLTGIQGTRLARLAVISVALVMSYQTALAFAGGPPAFALGKDGALIYTFHPAGALLYAAFCGAALITAWQQRRRLKGRWMLPGILGFGAGIFIELISPDLRSRAIGVTVSASAAFLITYAMLRAQIIDPLAGRAAQLQAVRDVGMAMTSSLRLEDVLEAIAEQAVQILKASGAAIFLNEGQSLRLAAEYNMSRKFRGYRLPPGEGLVGRVALLRQAARVENYKTDWQGSPDVPYARDAFGSVVAAPLIHNDEVMGVLLVVEALNGKRFDRDEMQLLELLSPQAAVAISNSRLFEQQRSLSADLEAATDQLRTLLAGLENPVIALDRRFAVIFANHAASALLGPGQALHTGASLPALAPPGALPPSPLQAMRALRRSGVFSYEVSLGEKVYLCNVRVLARLQGYVVVLNDISQYKALDRMKTQMIQMTSHQLKNPLFAAMNSLELLRDEGELIFNEDMRHDVNTIWMELQRMNRIIHNILNLERVQAGAVAFQEVHIEPMLRMVVHDFSHQAERKGIGLRVQVPDDLPPLCGDPHFLSQALANLVENSMKYTPPGGRISVRAESALDSVIIQVSDTGIGIPSEALSRVFERFFRAQQPGAEHAAGSGLGLSLVKAVVDAHGGRIWLDSEPNKGTTFYMALPTKQERSKTQ